jgi:Sec-independent protein translocase protein TatA
MLAFLTNLSVGEFVLVLVVAVLIFGRRLPEVAAKGAVHLQRLRRGLMEFRRESGFDEEIRRARRLVENPIKGAFEEAEKGPASWRPPSPRVAPHPDTVAEGTDTTHEATSTPDEVATGDAEQLVSSAPEEEAPAPADTPAELPKRQGLVRDEEPDAHS